MHRSYGCLVYTDKLQALLWSTTTSPLLHCIVYITTSSLLHCIVNCIVYIKTSPLLHCIVNRFVYITTSPLLHCIVNCIVYITTSPLIHCIVICMVYITSLMTWMAGPDQSARWLYYPNWITQTVLQPVVELYCSEEHNHYSKVELYQSAVELYQSGVLAVW